MMVSKKMILLLLLYLVVKVRSDNCVIPWMETGHEVAESQYLIDLSVKNTTHGMAHTYFPDTQYDIIIRPKRETLTFKEFYFKMENENKSMSYGALELREPELSAFSTATYCINRVVNLATPAKPNVTIGWQSPPTKSGCIVLIAHVKETDLRYHTANLTVCEDPRIELDDPGQLLENCCACEKAKYEMTFEGMWSKFTHPRGFPKKDWLAGFPTVIGAAHTPHYEIWAKYKNASVGLKKFAETGSSLDLELELKERRDNITTFIKFRGTNFKNKTLARAQLRVDRLNHVVSLVARINPSPDWFIGVSSLELCKADCSWLEEQTLNLYAYDAGSKSGLEFEEENTPITDDVIHPMNMSWPIPDKHRIPPFYDKSNNTHEVRPMAQIHLRRIRTYGSTCIETNDTDIDESCVTEWNSTWTCTAKCGLGFMVKERKYKPGFNETNCKAKIIDKKPCGNPDEQCEGQIDLKTCETMPWSGWRKCSQPCGQEFTQRTRYFKSHKFEAPCIEKFPEISLVENKDCGHPPCPNEHAVCNDNLYTQWTEWAPCSVTIGFGLHYRHRDKITNIISKDLDSNSDAGFTSCLYDVKVCEGIDPASITEAPVVDADEEIENPVFNSKFDTNLRPPECLLADDPGEACPSQDADSSYKWAYNEDKRKCISFAYMGCGGNDNRFDTERDCMLKCSMIEKIDCKMNEWGEWSSCTECKTERMRTRTVAVYASPLGRQCPRANLREKELCPRNDACKFIIKP